MDNKYSINLASNSEQTKEDPHPMLLKEREIDMDVSNSKRIRISASYIA